MEDDIELLKLVICLAKPGATRDGRRFLTYQMLKDSAAKINVDLAGAKRVFAAMRELGFEEIQGGPVSRYAIELEALIKIAVPIVKEWSARIDSELAK